jgi:hypothetical protein
MKTKLGRTVLVALLLMVTILYVSTHDYIAAAAWCSLGLAILLSGDRRPTGQVAPKTPKQYAMLFFIVLALGLFGYQLFRDLTDHGASRLPSTTPVHE